MGKINGMQQKTTSRKSGNRFLSAYHWKEYYICADMKLGTDLGRFKLAWRCFRSGFWLDSLRAARYARGQAGKPKLAAKHRSHSLHTPSKMVYQQAALLDTRLKVC